MPSTSSCANVNLPFEQQRVDISALPIYSNLVDKKLLSYFTAPALKNLARDAGKPLAVMHIPKTAGTSVITGISDALQSPVDVWGFDRALFGAFDKFSEFGGDVVRTIYPDPDTMPDAKLAMGHFSRSTLADRYPDAQLLTFIREPLTRLLSHWVYWRCTPDDHLTQWGSWREYVEVSRGSLKAFLTDPRIACQTDNIVTRMLLWPDARCGNDTFIDPNQDSAVLEDTFRKLDSFAYTDIIENPSFRSKLSEWLGANLPMNHLNPTARVSPSLRLRLDKELDPETMALLDARCRLDNHVWKVLAKCRLSNVDADALQRQTVIQAFSRYGALLAP